MKRIFISYRRADAQMAAGRLYDALALRFAPSSVFRDKEAIRPGYDWAEEIQDALKEGVVVLALIGPQWAESRDSEGRRRLDDPQDSNRLELETALSKNIPVIPVLVEGAVIPDENALPSSLAALRRRHAIRLRDDDWNADFSRLEDALQALGVTAAPATVEAVNPDVRSVKRRTAVRLAATGLLGAAAVGGATWGLLTDFGADKTTPGPSPGPTGGTQPRVEPPPVGAGKETSLVSPDSRGGTRPRPEPRAGSDKETPNPSPSPSGSTRPRPEPSSDLPTQNNWRWCAKCQGLWFNGNSAKGPCPAGGSHEAARSSNYSLVHDASVSGAQSNWRWCQKCQGLWFNGNEDKGVCPAGGAHDGATSSDYVVAETASAGATQDNWRWCQKCQGLWFNGNSAKGPCAAGGAHDGTASSNYRLTQVE